MKSTGIILDLLRTYSAQGTSARNIMATGKLFGFNENAMRVSLSRLVSRDMVENISRGIYRLTENANPINDFIDLWRSGEHRRRPWPEPLYCVLNLARPSKKDLWIIASMGFVSIAANLWARPDNLSAQYGQLADRMARLGLDEAAIVFTNVRLSARESTGCLNRYDIQTLASSYQKVLSQIEQSLETLDKLPVEDAMKQSFVLGGKAIQVLSKDPLLPDELMDSTIRTKLWQTMLQYDQVGREIWSSRHSQSPNVMPTLSYA
jgi:phenylacetic acid degradation operon negative regulatory protein